jgi:hypothetical protein
MIHRPSLSFNLKLAEMIGLDPLYNVLEVSDELLMEPPPPKMPSGEIK